MEKSFQSAEKKAEETRSLLSIGSVTLKDLNEASDSVEETKQALAKHDTKREETLRLYELARGNQESDLKTTSAKIQRVRERMAGCRLKSPFDGRILEVFVRQGAWISQYEKIALIADVKNPRLTLNIPENRIERINPKLPVVISYGNVQYRGYVERIGLQAETDSNGTTTIPVEVAFTTIPEKVIPGSSASGEIVLGIKKSALVLPRGAFLSTGEHTCVYRILGNKAYRTEVTYGLIQGTTVEIAAGLEEGDLVITSSYQDFFGLSEILLKPEGGKKQ
ncbi:MAG: efflux RND transporter periplasmic adaptor subunit [Spirochaetota bacterium]